MTGYTYNDLKSDNLCIGEITEYDPSSIKLIDFSLCTKYLDDNVDHILQTTVKHFKGNILMSSYNQMNFGTLSRRDDLQSLFYFLVYIN